MLSFNEKFICIFDKQSSKHHLITIQLQDDVVCSNCQNKSLHAANDCEKKMSPFQSIQKQKKKMKPIQQKKIGLVSFKNVFQKLGIVTQKQTKKEIYSPQKDKYFNFNQLSGVQYCVPIEYVQMTIILIRLSNHQIFNIYSSGDRSKFQENNQFKKDDEQCSMMRQPFIDNSQIKQRDRHRSIGQIMSYVRRWRQLAEKGLNGTRLNLQQAAVYIGIPKKSLDDYFYQLRAGEKYDFDFTTNLDKNISYLRRFVKQKIPTRNKQNNENKYQKSSDNLGQIDSNQNVKLPKKLKQYNLKQTKTAQTEIQRQKQMQIEREQQKMGRLSDSDVSSIQPIWPNLLPKNSDGIYDDEDSFFNDFKAEYHGIGAFDHLLKNST